MSKFHKLRIEGGPTGRSTSVFLDDREIRGVSKLVLRVDVNDVNTLWLRMFVETDVRVEIAKDPDAPDDPYLWESGT